VRFITTGDLNPHWFVYPASTIMYTLGLAYFVYWNVGHFLGWFPDLPAFAISFSTNPTSFYLIARVLAIALATLGIPLTYVLCRKMAGKGAALTAAALVAVSPLHIAFSKVVRTDPLMTVFLLAAMLSAVKAIESQAGRDFLMSGLFIGLATATKFPGISGAMIVVLAVVLAKPQAPASWTERGRWLSLAVLGGAIGFFGAAPFVFTGLREVYWSLVVEGSHAHLSATGGRGLPNYVWYLTGPLREAVGWPLELVALVGLGASFRLRSRPRLLLAGFSFMFLVGIGLSLKRWDRWIVPLVPMVAILASVGLETVVSSVAAWRSRPMVRDLVVIALGLVLMFTPAVEAYQRGAVTLDTRDIAKTWIEGHLPRGSKIALEQNTAPISRDEYQVFVVARGDLQRDATTRGFKGVLGDLRTLDPLRGKAIEYVVLDGYIDRYRAEEKSYPDEVRLYDELLASSDLLYELKPTEHTRGPVIRVLKLR